MNSEELEQSLRAEFGSYLKEVLAEMKQDVSEFQAKIESEFEKHRAQLGKIFEDFSAKAASEKELDSNFSDSVTEHLKLARDEGARITAAAIAEAEEMREETEAPANFADFRDSINEISNKITQSEILKSLVHHASKYTPRGAFFIVKNQHLVGWRIFGTEEHPNPEIIKEVYFPIITKTSLSESVESLATVESSYGTFPDDSEFLEKLGFGEPANMYSVPLVVRGRGVAVLYADRGGDGESVNIEALESLLRVAGMRVEVLASTTGFVKARQAPEVEVDEGHVSDYEESDVHESEYDSADTFGQYSPPEPVETTDDVESPVSESEFEPVEYDAQPEVENDSWSQPTQDFTSSDTEVGDYPASYDADDVADADEEPASYDFDDATPSYDEEAAPSYDDDAAPSYDEDASPSFDEAPSYDEDTAPSYDDDAPSAYDEDAVPSYEERAFSPETDFETDVSESYDDDESTVEYDVSDAGTDDFESAREPVQFEDSPDEEPGYDVEPPSFEPESEPAGFDSQEAGFEEPSTTGFEYDNGQSDFSFQAPVETVESEAPAEAEVEEVVTSPPVRSRFGDRNVDLPIEVEEDERRYHNDARRFARLLVSEIKLYNEQKVKEGRESADLYEKLREAIDRSREMYEKRVQAPVAAKFDYFNYELVNTLAEGDETKLGGSYPGASV